ncbi:hypothetical protein WA026_023391, partial [Henosepilachna vigintioctopunctata]
MIYEYEMNFVSKYRNKFFFVDYTSITITIFCRYKKTMTKRKRPNLTNRKPKAKSNAKKSADIVPCPQDENALEETKTSMFKPIH